MIQSQITMSTKHTGLLKQFHASRRIELGRKFVSLPKDLTALQDNRAHAERRFQTLHKRLCHKEYAMCEKYAALHCAGALERVHPKSKDRNILLATPRGKKTKRDMTKCRIVYDASFHEKEFPSLNEVLEIGPNLLPNVLSVLLRFRLGQYVILGDVNQAFLQLLLDPAET
jgi:hypothetical protein